MRALKDLELGLMFWASEDADESLAFVEQFGLQAGQLGFGGGLKLDDAAQHWQLALARHPEFRIETAVCSYLGEDYTDIAAVQKTVGLVPESTRAERVTRTKEVSAIAADLGIPSVACHIGFIPEERSSSEYGRIRDVARDICDRLSERGQNFSLETGQEPAPALLAFLDDVDRPNLKINFDPANMILYGTGDPIEAVRILGDHVTSVHCKDGDWPPKNQPGALGVEQPLGSGQVDFPKFLAALRDVGYRGILSIEREEPDAARRTADIRHAVRFLRAGRS